MKAVTFQALHAPLVFETLPDPTPDPGQVVVRVGRCGICGSDLHMTEDAAYGCKHGDVLGHEFAGEVVDLGREVEGLKAGDLVSVIPLRSCGRCEHCRKGEVQWCAEFGLQGGGYAEYALSRPNQCVKLPANLSLADGAIIEPLAVALHGVNLSGLKAGDKVLILGAGPIGLAVAFWAKRLGAGKVAVQDIADRHRGLFTRNMSDAQSADRLCELNVLEQASNVCRTTIVQDAWRRGQPLSIHGWIYRLRNGLIRDLGLNVSREGTLDKEFDVALRTLVNAELPRETPPRSAAIGER